MLTKFFRKIIVNFFCFFLNFTPKFIISFIAKIILKINKKEDYFSKFKFNNEYTGSKKNLIYLDYNNAVGDFIVLLRTILKLHNDGERFDVLVHIKFKGIFEKLNLDGVNIIYKKVSLGLHYSHNKNPDVTSIYNESYNSNLSYDKIFYFNKYKHADALFYMMNIKYSNIILMKDVWKKGNGNGMWINSKAHFFFNLFLIINRKKLKIISVGKKRKHKKIYLADFAYYIYTGKAPKESLINFSLEKYFFSKSKIENSVCIMLDSFPRTKALKMNYLINLINERFANKKIVFVGDSTSQAKILKNELENEIFDYVGKTKTILDLINVISSCSFVLAYDTSILHIATILNKDTLLIYNKVNYIVKKEYEAWLSYSINKLTYDNSFFEKLPDSKNDFGFYEGNKHE